MDTSPRWLIAVTLVFALVLPGCGSDSSTGPEGEGDNPGDAAAAALTETLVSTMQQAFFASLVADPATVTGQSGTIVITGNVWAFQGYSPDGELFIDGQLDVDKGAYPIPAVGELVLSGSQQGTLIVDITVTVQGSSAAAAGTIQLGDQVWDVGALQQSD